MTARQLSALFLVSSLVLAGCSSKKNDEAQEAPGAQSSALQGVTDVLLLSGENLLTQAAVRPAAVLGVYVTHFLSGNATVQAKSAIDGIAAQMQLYFGQVADSESSAAAIEQLGTTLQVNIIEMLNRNVDRSKALDDYIAFLEGAMIEARATGDNLEGQRKELDSALSVQRKEVAALKREVDKAVKDKNFALAGAKQELLGLADIKFSTMENQKKQIVAAQDLLEELLQIADERLAAITSNRDALLAGVAVTDLPGVEELGILKKGSRRR